MDIARIFNKDARTRIKVPETRLTDQQLIYFNGFNEIGGDTTKYQDAVTWYERTEHKMEAMVACIVILEKPSSWLFGGIKNDDIKKFVRLIPKIESMVSELNEDGVSGGFKVRKQMELDNLIASSKVMTMADGKMIFSGERKGTVHPVLARSMALYTDSEIDSFDGNQMSKMSNTRMWWKSVFPLVNISRMKRVALLYLELCPKKHLITQAVKWINAHNGRPSKVKIFGKNEKTTKIMKDDLKRLMDNKHLWKDYAKVFKHKIPTDTLFYAEQTANLSAKQEQFICSIKGLNDIGEDDHNQGICHDISDFPEPPKEDDSESKSSGSISDKSEQAAIDKTIEMLKKSDVEKDVKFIDVIPKFEHVEDEKEGPEIKESECDTEKKKEDKPDLPETVEKVDEIVEETEKTDGNVDKPDTADV